MKIAILADIHANYYALEPVLAEIKKNDVKHLFILGDILGYYYNPELIFAELKNWDYELISGNHEAMLLDIIDNKADQSLIRKKYGSGLEIARNNLNDKQIEVIRNLPARKEITLDGINFQLCHGSPWDRDNYIYPDSAATVLEKCSNQQADFVFMGHTHHPFVYKGSHSLIINVGSVGQSRVMGGIANWGLLETKNSAFILKHTPYKTDKLLKEIKEIDPQNNYLSEILKRNRLV